MCAGPIGPALHRHTGLCGGAGRQVSSATGKVVRRGGRPGNPVAPSLIPRLAVPVKIKELHTDRSEADLTAILPLWQHTSRWMFGGRFSWGATQLLMDTAPAAHHEKLTLAVFDDAGAAGFLFCELPTDVNTDVADLLVFLRADHEQDPAAAAAHVLLAELRTRLAQRGRTRLAVNLPVVTPPGYLPFRVGPVVYHAICFVLDLAAADEDQLAQWAAPGPKNADYRIVRWVNTCPDDLIEAYAASLAAMSDAPQQDLALDHAVNSVQRVRETERSHAEHGMLSHVVAAVAPDGQVAGSCLVGWFPDQDSMGIWNTSVIGGHRGRGLGLRIKADSALWLRGLSPKPAWIYTFNNIENEQMIAVNRQMGYTPVADLAIYSGPTDLDASAEAVPEAVSEGAWERVPEAGPSALPEGVSEAGPGSTADPV